MCAGVHVCVSAVVHVCTCANVRGCVCVRPWPVYMCVRMHGPGRGHPQWGCACDHVVMRTCVYTSASPTLVHGCGCTCKSECGAKASSEVEDESLSRLRSRFVLTRRCLSRRCPGSQPEPDEHHQPAAFLFGRALASLGLSLRSCSADKKSYNDVHAV